MSDWIRVVLGRLTPAGRDPRAPVGRGAPALTAADIAAALGFVTRRGPGGEPVPDRPAQRLLLYLWAGHDSLRDRETLLLHLAEEATRWLPPGGVPEAPGELRRLLEIALDERRLTRLCLRCIGTGVVPDGGRLVFCPICGGLGWRRWGAQRLAEAFGVTRHAWRERWAKPYARIVQMLEDVERRGVAAVRRALRR